MTKDEMIAKYHELYEAMKMSGDVSKMKIFGKAEKRIFAHLAQSNPQLADGWLAELESVCWDNYLTKEEMLAISSKMINENGTHGFHWTYEIFIPSVERLGGVVESKPHYNTYALCATANMIYSDMAEEIAEDMGYKTAHEVPNEKMALSCYKKAVAYLNDADANFHIRKYFKHIIYD
jgi:hypothetical protein